MGLSTSHNCWQGSCSSFNDWRAEICSAAGFGNLREYYGFGGEKIFNGDPLNLLLNHSDCDGELKWEDCSIIAFRLEECLPNLKSNELVDKYYIEKTEQFIVGLEDAFECQENVEFH